MKVKYKGLLVAGISGALGGMTGSASGSNSWVIVGIVSAATAIIVAWLLSGYIK